MNDIIAELTPNLFLGGRMTRLRFRLWRWVVLVSFCGGVPVFLPLHAAKAEEEFSLEEYREHAMRRTGNPKKGKEVFSGSKALCAQCHSTERDTRLAGPNLATAGDKFSRADLILSILRPSESIMTGFSLQRCC